MLDRIYLSQLYIEQKEIYARNCRDIELLIAYCFLLDA